MIIDELVPLPDAAKLTSWSESRIRKGLKSGEVKGYKVGRDWVLDPDEVKRLATDHPLLRTADSRS
jgi:hypothetical protein